MQSLSPGIKTTSSMAQTTVDGLLGRTWKPTLSIVGAGGLPSIENGGNVLRPYTELKAFLSPSTDCG